MTQTVIGKKRKEIEKKLQELNRTREIILLEWQHLKAMCEHPKAYPYCAMGEMGTTCPDCGWST